MAERRSDRSSNENPGINISDPKLLRLLYLDIFGKKKNQKIDNDGEDESAADAIAKFLHENPQVARAKYKFTEKNSQTNTSSNIDGQNNRTWCCYPLHIAVSLGASVKTVQALYNTFPEAMSEKCIFHDVLCFTPLQAACCFQRSSIDVISLLLEKCPEAIYEKSNNHEMTLLHLSCFRNATIEVVRLLLEKWPESIMERDRFGQLPLHMACGRGASLEVVSLFLEKWPDSIREKTRGDRESPFQLACGFGSLEVVSFLFEKCPEYIREKDRFGHLPLHTACGRGVSLDVISLLLDVFPQSIKEKTKKGEVPLHQACSCGNYDIVKFILQKYHSAVKEKDSDGKTPSEHFSTTNCDAKRLVEIVYCLIWKKVDNLVAKSIMDDCIKTKFWDGTKIVLDVYPGVLQVMGIPNCVIPRLFFSVGCHCKLSTMWNIISDRQDLVSNNVS